MMVGSPNRDGAEGAGTTLFHGGYCSNCDDARTKPRPASRGAARGRPSIRSSIAQSQPSHQDAKALHDVRRDYAAGPGRTSDPASNSARDVASLAARRSEPGRASFRKSATTNESRRPPSILGQRASQRQTPDRTAIGFTPKVELGRVAAVGYVPRLRAPTAEENDDLVLALSAPATALGRLRSAPAEPAIRHAATSAHSMPTRRTARPHPPGHRVTMMADPESRTWS